MSHDSNLLQWKDSQVIKVAFPQMCRYQCITQWVLATPTLIGTWFNKYLNSLQLLNYHIITCNDFGAVREFDTCALAIQFTTLTLDCSQWDHAITCARVVNIKYELHKSRKYSYRHSFTLPMVRFTVHKVRWKYVDFHGTTLQHHGLVEIVWKLVYYT